MSAPVEILERVRRKAVVLGPPGERWLRDIPQIVADLERSWRLNVGPAIPGGTGAFVAVARTTDGTDAILKVSIPDGLEGHSPFGEELHALQLGNGFGYVRVLRVDADRRAMLQEHLGRPLGDLDLPVESQIDVIVSTLRDAWGAFRPIPFSEPEPPSGGFWITSRWTSSTTRPATSPRSWNRWTWTEPW